MNFSRMVDIIEFYYYQFRKHASVSQLLVINARLHFRECSQIWGNTRFLLYMVSKFQGIPIFFQQQLIFNSLWINVIIILLSLMFSFWWHIMNFILSSLTSVTLCQISKKLYYFHCIQMLHSSSLIGFSNSIHEAFYYSSSKFISSCEWLFSARIIFIDFITHFIISYFISFIWIFKCSLINRLKYDKRRGPSYASSSGICNFSLVLLKCSLNDCQSTINSIFKFY